MLEMKARELPADDPVEPENVDVFYPDDDDFQMSDYGSACESDDDDDRVRFSFED